MKVYFLKSDVSQFVIFPEPENLEDYFLVEVENENELERKTAVVFKGKFRLVEKCPSEDHEWNGKSWVISKEKQTALLNEQRALMWEKIKQKRYDNLRAGVYVKSADKWFHSNDESRQQYTFMRTLPQLPSDMMWKTMDNTFVPFTKAILDELSLQLIDDEQADFANAERHKQLMEQAENPLDYDFSDGWTPIFTE
ncbi:DUF4376 domain-containing protein [Rodentibacter caecimuris]|uniref:DUF4376 domain-containing protein n=1 Tax=Rodentibacter caecimuris TaxID=1796644 RepID=UPI002119D255|nr:DUF4376 domain-containing protein [Rodentibacter heylii]MCQ9124374.1 DUF4376 domain-containing protein [Rodentibacter heylii]